MEATSYARIAIAVFGAVAETDGLTTNNVTDFGTICMDIAATQLERDDKLKYRMNSGDTTCNIATVSDLEHQASPLKNVARPTGTDAR